MGPESIRSLRIAQLEDALKIQYEKRAEFERELAVNASAPSKFELRQRLVREVLPDIRKFEVEYAQLLADDAAHELISGGQAEEFLIQVKKAVDHSRTLPEASRSPEFMHLLEDVAKKLNDPGKVAAAKLKVALPIIPLIASYEMEMNTEAVLTNLWRKLKALFGGKV